MIKILHLPNRMRNITGELVITPQCVRCVCVNRNMLVYIFFSVSVFPKGITIICNMTVYERKLNNEVSTYLQIGLNFFSLPLPFAFPPSLSRVVHCYLPVFPLPSVFCLPVCHLVSTLRFTSHIYNTEAFSVFHSFM